MPLGIDRTHHHRDQIQIFPVLRDSDPLQQRLQRLSNVLARQPQQTCFVLVDLDPHRLAEVAPVVAHIADMRIIPHHLAT